ncbi:MAG: DNA primase [Oscillospiraceae bacterium]
MAFPQSFLDELTARSDIVDVVSSYVALTRKGGNLFGLCPFHNEKTGSFSVSPDKQIYYCFGCKKGGGVVNFIMDIENLSFPDAVRFLARRANMEVPEEQGDSSAKQRQRLLELNRSAARFYYDTLQRPEGRKVQEYIDSRRITKATAVNFGLGASLEEWDVLISAMTKQGYTKRELLDAGLAVQSKNGGIYDKFRGRLMFPVIDVRGDVVAFGGRIIGPGEPKYMNSQETMVYSKRRNLYGINLAKKTKRPNFILCEGNIDVVMLHQAGFDNAVASMGTALTTEQTRLLSRYTKELVLCYDADGAGELATQKALALLENSEFTVRVLRLPRRLQDGAYVKQDPDDFIKYQGRDAFERLLSGSENGIEFRMDQTAAKYDLRDDAQRLAYCEEVSAVLAGLHSAVEREVYTARAAQAAGISAESMKAEVERQQRRLAAKAKKERQRREMNPVLTSQPRERSLRYENLRSALAEEGLIRLLMLDQGAFGAEPPLTGDKFSSPLLGRIFDALWAFHLEGRPLSVSLLSPLLSPEEMSHLTELLQKPENLAAAERTIREYAGVVREEYEKRSGTAEDPLLAARDKYKNKSGYGGKQHA